MSEYAPSIESRPLRPPTEIEKKLLREINTSDLVREIETRSGVDVIEIPPYTKINLTVEGCAVLLKVID